MMRDSESIGKLGKESRFFVRVLVLYISAKYILSLIERYEKGAQGRGANIDINSLTMCLSSTKDTLTETVTSGYYLCSQGRKRAKVVVSDICKSK